MPFHHYKPLKNPQVDTPRYRQGLAEEDDFQINLTKKGGLSVALLGGLIDALFGAPLQNVVKRIRKEQRVNLKDNLRWMFKGRVRQFILHTPTLTLQCLGAGHVLTMIKPYKNRALYPWEYVVSSFFGGLASSVWSTPIDFLRSKQKITKKYLLQISRETFHNFGLLGFYRSWPYGLMRDTVYCVGWMGIVPMLHVWLGKHFAVCKKHSSITALPVSIFTACICSPLMCLNIAKENALTFTPEIERASVVYQLKSMHAQGTLFRGIEVYAFRLTFAFYLLDRIRMRTIKFRSERKLAANPVLGHVGFHAPDLGLGVNYSMQDVEERVFTNGWLR